MTAPATYGLTAAVKHELLREMLRHKRAWDRLTMWEAEARGFGDYLLAKHIKSAIRVHSTCFWLAADALGWSGLTADELTARGRALAGGDA